MLIYERKDLFTDVYNPEFIYINNDILIFLLKKLISIFIKIIYKRYTDFLPIRILSICTYLYIPRLNALLIFRHRHIRIFDELYNLW